MTRHVVVVIGVGGMGEAIARRQGAGRTTFLADVNDGTLTTVATAMAADGYDVHPRHVDVADRDSVERLAQAAAKAGTVTQVIHTAGLSPTQATAEAILSVDLYGAALVLSVFGTIIATEGAGVVIASLAGHLLGDLSLERQHYLATAPVDELLALPFLTEITDPGEAYSLAKYGNRLRVMADSIQWGRRGARLNSISSGIVASPMGRQELEGDRGQVMRALIDASGSRRIGTPNDIADATAFLLGSTASFVTGADFVVDGGAVAALKVRTGELTVTAAE